MAKTFIVTYSPASGGDNLAHLVEVAAGLRGLVGDRPLYADVRQVGSTVRFVVELDPAPTYGAASIACGLVGRATSEAGAPGKIDEVSCEDTAG